MPDSNRRTRPEINRMQRQELLKDRQTKSRVMVLNVLGFAFFMASFMYLGILLAGILKPETESSGQPMWWVLPAAAVMLLPGVGIVVSQMLKAVARARTPQKAYGKGMTALLVALCAGESVAVLGLMVPFLHGSTGVGVAMIVASWVVMAGAVAWVRPKVVDALLVATLAERDPG